MHLKLGDDLNEIGGFEIALFVSFIHPNKDLHGF